MALIYDESNSLQMFIIASHLLFTKSALDSFLLKGAFSDKSVLSKSATYVSLLMLFCSKENGCKSTSTRSRNCSFISPIFLLTNILVTYFLDKEGRWSLKQ